MVGCGLVMVTCKQKEENKKWFPAEGIEERKEGKGGEEI